MLINQTHSQSIQSTMRKVLFAFMLLGTQLMTAQEADIKKSIQVFFDGLQTGDTLKIQSVCSKAMALHTIAESAKGAKFTAETLKEFYGSVASIPKDLKIEERLLSYKIQVDGSMAHVWTPYEFYVNGKMTHSGVNSFQLFKDNGTWKIVYIIDTRRRAQ